MATVPFRGLGSLNGSGNGHAAGPEPLSDRLPPYNLRAEQGVLGSALLANSVIDKVRDRLAPEDFYRDVHQIAWRVMLDMRAAGRAVDPITYPEEMTRRDLYEHFGGDDYLSEICNAVPHPLDGQMYAEIVRDKATAREAIEAANEMLARGYANNTTADDLVKDCQRRFAAVAARIAPDDQVGAEGRTVAPPFPLEILPDGLIHFVKFHARALPCAPDFLAVPALAVAGAVMGRSVALRLKRTWYEEANIWAIIAGTPGSTKSPALKAVVAPLKRMMAQLRRQHAMDKLVWKEAKKTEEREWRKSGGKGTFTIDADDQPTPERRIVVMNTTVEGLSPILAENPRGIIMVCDELSGWLNAMNQYKASGADQEFYLQLWNRAWMVTDRKGTDTRKSSFTPDPFFGLTGAITIDKLKQMPASIDGKRQDDGFIERPLYSIPDNVVPYWTDDADPLEVDSAWAGALKRLFDRPMRDDDEFGQVPRIVCMSPDAHEVFTRWHDAHIAETQAEDFPKELKGAWSKFRSQFGRLLLALDQLHWAYAERPILPEGADPEPEPEQIPDIEVGRVYDAIQLIDYFKAHFRIVLSHVQGAVSDNEDGRAILRWVASRPEPRFTEREARDNFRGRFREHPENLAAALAWLVDRGLARKIVPAPSATGGRPKTAVYELHPSALITSKGDAQMRNTSESLA